METEMIDRILARAEDGGELSAEEIAGLLSAEQADDIAKIYDCAYRVKRRHVGSVAYFRGIIECSNICGKDCLYCGIRRSNRDLERFQMGEEEIVREALWCHDNGYGSAVIQSGERQDEGYVEMIERVVRTVKQRTGGELGITLSIGEQSPETYRRWREAGAHRYLLRIETSNPELYRSLHPRNHDFETRCGCLSLLRQGGWQVGTGVMIGLPGQTIADLARDIVFMRGMDVDMIGMGPYIPHRDTPLGRDLPTYSREHSRGVLNLGLKMIAVARIVMKDINIAATTALQALDETGREQGLLCGANVIMPNVTHTSYRSSYRLYDNKPCVDENSEICRACLTRRIEGIGETIGFNQWGDSPHYFARSVQRSTRD